VWKSQAKIWIAVQFFVTALNHGPPNLPARLLGPLAFVSIVLCG